MIYEMMKKTIVKPINVHEIVVNDFSKYPLH